MALVGARERSEAEIFVSEARLNTCDANLYLGPQDPRRSTHDAPDIVSLQNNGCLRFLGGCEQCQHDARTLAHVFSRIKRLSRQTYHAVGVNEDGDV